MCSRPSLGTSQSCRLTFREDKPVSKERSAHMTPTESALEQAQLEQEVPPPTIVILIHRNRAGNWTIEPEDEKSNERLLDDDRRKDARNTFDGQWRSRHGKR